MWQEKVEKLLHEQRELNADLMERIEELENFRENVLAGECADPLVLIAFMAELRQGRGLPHQQTTERLYRITMNKVAEMLGVLPEV